jgi:uncharacterized protein (TIGR01777 family)
MKFLISGGSGLIGRNFMQSRSGRADQYFVLTRSKKGDALPGTVSLLEWDGKTLGDWARIVNEVDVVLNLAGENIGDKRWSADQKKRIIESRVSSGQVLAQAVLAAEHKPDLFIQASAIGIYGTENNQVFDETSSPGDDFLAGVGKQWESSIQGLESTGTRVVFARFGVLLDKKEGAFPKMILPFKLFAGGPLGSGQQWVSWIHIEDVARALNFFVEHAETQGIYNVTSPNPVRNAEFGKQIGAVLNRPYWIPVPGFMLRLILGEMSTLVLDGQNVLPKKLLQDGYSFKYNLHTQAIQDLLK